MGRNAKEVNKIAEVYCLDYSLLVQQGYFKKETNTSNGVIAWYQQGKVAEQAVIQIIYNAYLDKWFVILIFNVINPDRSLAIHKQTIELVEVDSNLGKGKLVYFLCPITGRKCRKLYKLANRIIWQCRLAFDKRLYYPLQLCSKMNSYQVRKISYDNRVEKLKQKRTIFRYRGKLTKRFLQISNLSEKSHQMYDLMWSELAMPLKIRRLLQETTEEFTAKEMLGIERDF